MDSRHGGFTRPTIGAWIVTLAMTSIGAGCIPGTVSGVSNGDGGSIIAVELLACTQTPSGCLCAARPDQPGDLVACSSASVATHTGEQGTCCGSSDVCTCDSFACKSDSTLGFCQCGPIADIPASLEGAAAAACPAPSAGQTCCMTMDTRSCICSTGDCDSGAMSVPNCTVALIDTCPTGQMTVASCK